MLEPRAMPGAIMPGPLWGKNKRSKGSITLLRQSLISQGISNYIVLRG
jgi:hypothetical protein